ncbi:MAG: hypothetical protein AB7F86_02035 [Bdellovibrionales bacterium]
MRKIWTLATLLVSWQLTACSTHWRESGSEVTAADIQSLFADLDTAQAQSNTSGNMSEVLQMKDDGATQVYYAQAPVRKVRVVNILSVNSLAFLGLNDDEYSVFILPAARVLLLDLPTDSGHQVGLIVGVKTDSDQFRYTAFKGTGGISSGKFSAEVDDGNGHKLTLESLDVDKDELDPVIQISVFQHDQNGDGVYIGKFNSLTGFLN